MALPTGIICLWYGSIANIPTGWVLCNGANGTPDLRDKFLVGAGSTYAVDATGGAVQHNHGFTADLHNHDIPVGTGISAGTDLATATSPAFATGTTNNTNHLPPYHALAWIMKT